MRLVHRILGEGVAICNQRIAYTVTWFNDAFWSRHMILHPYTCVCMCVCVCVCVRLISLCILVCVKVNGLNWLFRGVVTLHTHFQDYDVSAIEKLAYTCRQLNSCSTALQFFNLVVQCSLDQIEEAKVALLKCFDLVEVAYAHNKSAESGQSKT